VNTWAGDVRVAGTGVAVAGDLFLAAGQVADDQPGPPPGPHRRPGQVVDQLQLPVLLGVVARSGRGR
jgi:hypothetical protein